MEEIMTKICHITTVHNNRYDVRIFEKECSYLAKAGYDVTLLVNDELADEKKNSVCIRSLNKKTYNRLDRIIRISNCAYKAALRTGAEIVHVHDPELLGVAVRLQKKGKKVIFDSHEFTSLQILTKDYIPHILRKPLSLIYRRYETRKINKLSGLIKPCYYDGKDFFDNIRIPSVIVGNYPMITSRDMVDKETILSRERKVCYVGSIDESRGALKMVDAAFLAGVKLVMIGEVTPELMKIMEHSKGFSNIEFLGKVSHERALQELSKCRIGLSLLQDVGQYSKLDNLPTKIYEYMDVGVPTIMSNFPFYRKQLEKYEFGIAVNPSSEQDIAQAIIELIDDYDKQYELIKAGKMAIRNEFCWDKDAEKLISFYEKL